MRQGKPTFEGPGDNRADPDGPGGGPDAWQEAVVRLEPGWKLQTPQVLFPKLDPDRIAELAEQHLQGQAF